MSAPTLMTIKAFEHAPAPLPAPLEERLNGSPAKTPEDLAVALEKHRARSELLRNAHLDAVKDRAARDNQRVLEAAARKRRAAANNVEKIQRRQEAADSKFNAKREAAEAKRAAWTARRAEMASNVAEARKAADAARQVAHLESLEAEKLASTKHEKTIQAIHDKSANVVKHAAAVVAARKEKEAQDAAAAAAKLADRMALAEIRRESAAPNSPGSSAPPSPGAKSSKAVLSRVLNEQKVEAGLKEVAFAKRNAKAEAKRVAILKEVTDKAERHHADREHKLAALAAKANGTDAETAAHKSALWTKMLNAENARQLTLKQRMAGCKEKGDTTSVIIVHVDKAASVRMPPPALVKRLTTVSNRLLATAPSRQAGAAARKLALRSAAALRLAKAAERRAAVVGKTGAALGARKAKLEGKLARALVTKAIADGRKAHVLAQEAKRVEAASKARKGAAQAAKDKGAAAATHCEAVGERRAAAIRRTAKVGVIAVRAAANRSRRVALAAAKGARAEALAARCVAAAAAKATKTADVVAAAKQAQKVKCSDA